MWDRIRWHGLGFVVILSLGLSGCHTNNEGAEIVVVTPRAIESSQGSSSLAGVEGEMIADTTAPPLPIATPKRIEPEIVYGKTNHWSEVIPPAGWMAAEGDNQLVLAYQGAGETAVLGTYVAIARWRNQIGENGWVASFPDGQEEVNGRYTFQMAGQMWQGVFVRGTTTQYRAFWGYSNEDLDYSYTVLVYMPASADLPSIELTDKSDPIFEAWIGIAPDVNVILKRLTITKER